MKKIAVTLLLLCSFFVNTAFAESLILEYDGGIHNYTGAVYDLKVNGKLLTDLPLEPIVFNDRALVPVREVFEALGAKVDYDTYDKSTSITYVSTSVRLRIGSETARVNGKNKTIPDGAVPRLIAKWGENAKTMVPVRFISENVGLDVGFDGEKGVISITDPSVSVRPSPNPTAAPSFSNKLNKLEYKEESGVVTVTVSASEKIEKISNAAVTSSGVLYVDVYGVSYTTANKTEVNLGAVKSVRFGQHEEAARIALDTENMKKYNAALSEDKKSVVIKVTADENGNVSQPVSPSATPSQSPSETATPAPTQSPTAPQIKYSDKKLVVIDAGHGGSDPGAIGYLMTDEEKQEYYAALESTEPILATMKPGTGKKCNEKDIALSVATKVKNNLEANGVNVVMTRTGDTYPTLDSRPELANSKGAVIFVSIHVNSTTASVTGAKGIEVYYSESNNDNTLGVTSKQLSNSLLDSLIDFTAAKSRGVKTGDLLVNRKCLMPSSLVEIGFVNNPDELELMTSDSYQNKLAAGVTEGIMTIWKKVKLPKN